MFNTNYDHDPDILRMGLVVSETEAEAEKNPYHDGSGPPSLLYPSSSESTPPRNAVVDVLNTSTFHLRQQSTTRECKFVGR